MSFASFARGSNEVVATSMPASSAELIGDQDERDRDEKRDQLDPPHSEGDGGDQHCGGDAEVDPHVALGAEDVDHALEREVEALEEGRSPARSCAHDASSSSRVSITSPWS